MNAEQALMKKLAEGLTDEELGILAEQMNGASAAEAPQEANDEVTEFIEALEKEASELSDEDLAIAIEIAAEQVDPQAQDALVKSAAAELEGDIEEMEKEASYWQAAGAQLFEGFEKAAAARQQHAADHGDDGGGAPEPGSRLLAALGITE